MGNGVIDEKSPERLVTDFFKTQVEARKLVEQLKAVAGTGIAKAQQLLAEIQQLQDDDPQSQNPGIGKG